MRVPAFVFWRLLDLIRIIRDRPAGDYVALLGGSMLLSEFSISKGPLGGNSVLVLT